MPATVITPTPAPFPAPKPVKPHRDPLAAVRAAQAGIVQSVNQAEAVVRRVRR